MFDNELEAENAAQSSGKEAIMDAIRNAEIHALETENELELICMSDIEMKPISWLWPDRIACGKLTVIAGNPGLGKSQLTAALAATVTTGAVWPDGSEPATIGNVIFLSAEDDACDTIKPRLMAAGADTSRCHILDAVTMKSDGGVCLKRSFDLTQDIERLGAAIARLGNVRLAVIDPISSYLGSTDSHNNADMRGLLAPLSAMAAEHGVAIILLTHLNKSTTQDAIGRVIGSIGLIAAARAGYIVVKDEKTPETRYFVPIKNNIGNDYDGFAFHIEGVELSEGIKTSSVCWHEGLLEAQKILHPEPEEKPTATNGASDFLRELLSYKPMMMSDVMEEAEGAGYSKHALQRAATKLMVKRKKLGIGGGWQWSLPKLNIYGQANEDAEGVEDSNHLSEVSSVEDMQPS